MKVKYMAITLMSAVATGLLYTFYRFGMLSFVTLIPYFYSIFKLSIDCEKPKAYRLGLLFSFPYYASVLYWFCYQYPLDYMGFSNAVSAVYIAVAWLGLSLLYTLTMALVPFVTAKFLKTEFGKSHRYFAPAIATCVWVIVEWMHTKTFLGVPWTRLALTQQSCIYNLQTASVFGSYSVSFIIVAVNAIMAYGLYKLINEKANKKAYLCFISASAIVVANLIYGTVSVKLDGKKDSTAVLVSALQGNMKSNEKWELDGVDKALEIYSRLVRQAADEGAEIAVFPETAFPIDLREDVWFKDRLSELAQEENITLLVGAFDSGKNEDGEYESYNAVYMFKTDGTVDENVYYKRKLVPFGEYLPCEKIFCTLFPFLEDLNLFTDVLTPGDGNELFETEHGKVGALICFDSIYELLSADSVNEGAELIVLGTNDSWFVDSSAIYEHNGQAVLRAIENRRYVVRAANTGLSSVISPTGEVLSSIAPLEEGQITEAVSFRTEKTFFTRFPNLIIAVLHVFVISAFVAPWIAERLRRRKLK